MKDKKNTLKQNLLSNVIPIVPAYNPPWRLVDLVSDLSTVGFRQIVVVNDGSHPGCNPVFSAVLDNPDVQVLRHAVNLGKGAALKTGFNHVLCGIPDCRGVVTLDADGQHLIEDVRRTMRTFMEQPEKIVLGSRSFHAESVPFFNKSGNLLVRALFRWITGCRLRDTQTGLRVLPTFFLPELLKVQANGYEFETIMLLKSLKNGIPIVEQEIETIYLTTDGVSHFKPFLDSMKICLALLNKSH